VESGGSDIEKELDLTLVCIVQWEMSHDQVTCEDEEASDLKNIVHVSRWDDTRCIIADRSAWVWGPVLYCINAASQTVYFQSITNVFYASYFQNSVFLNIFKYKILNFILFLY
jgi:hypothetical protein